MTRSEMRLALLTSVMTWRPQLDAAGVQAEADVLWQWVEKPAGEPVPLLPLVASPPGEVGTGLAQRLRIETVAAAPVEVPPIGALRRQRLIDTLAEIARDGRPCPSNATLAERIADPGAVPCRETEIGRHLRVMATAGIIAIERPEGDKPSTPRRRIRLIETGAVTGWTEDVGRPPNLSPTIMSKLERLEAMLTAAAEADEPCPSNLAMAAAVGLYGDPEASKMVARLAREGRLVVERRGRHCRRITVVATGRTTAWNIDPEGEKEPPAACAPTDGPSSPAAPPVSRSDPAPTTPAPVARGAAPSPAASSAPSPVSPPVSAAPSSPPAAASAPVAAPEPPVVRLAAGPVPKAPKARRDPQPPPPPPPRPVLRPDEQAAIDEAVSKGRVKVVPTGATGIVQKNHKGEAIAVVPPAFPDVADWEREAAVYLQKRGVQVVTNGRRKWLLDGRWSVTSEELVARANKKRAHQKLPPIEISERAA